MTTAPRPMDIAQTTAWLQQRCEAVKPEKSCKSQPSKPQNAPELELKEQRETRNVVVEPIQPEISIRPGIHATLQNSVLNSAATETPGPESREVPPLPSPTVRKATTLEQPLTLCTPTSADIPKEATIIPQYSSKNAPEQVESTIQTGEFITPVRNLQSSKVPSSRIGRLFHYGGTSLGLAASLGYGAASELLRRTGGASSEGQSSVFMTEANIKRLVSKLSQMRGAALKLGQFLSIQDTHVLPPEVDQIFRRVQDSAHYMPDWQMEKVMASSLGPNWAENFQSFERLPFAAASIGQVHGAVLAASVSPTGRPEPVAVKIQFPNIVNSIDSDLSYIKVLLTAGRLLPKGLFLDRSVQVLKDELADECDYTREGSFLTKFGSPGYLGGDSRFKVPWVWEGSTKSVLAMERVHGTSVGDADISGMSKKDRDDTDRVMSVELVDFGATREYSKEFMDSWLLLLQAAASEDRDSCIEWSTKLGYLTGKENQIMLDAHVNSMMLLATPFKASTPQPFNFGPGSTWSGITTEIRAQIPVMLMHRLTPPPRETYSLNRKLSGTFLLAARLGARIDARGIWDRVVSKYQFSS
ncbi:ABC1 like protein, mitochondrial [Termitomyces sp. J132]|nr:ABC1 like protein, mitochondrial [Termitomyces sp. J132]